MPVTAPCVTMRKCSSTVVRSSGVKYKKASGWRKTDAMMGTRNGGSSWAVGCITVGTRPAATGRPRVVVLYK